jgi:hypothetical protein
MLKSIKKLVAIAAVALVSAPALAVPTTWNYSGVCNSGNCGVIPTITGSLSGDPSLEGSANELSQFFLFGELTSYAFQLGSYSYSGSSAVGSYNLDAAGNIIGGSMVFGEVGLFSLELLDLGAFKWSFKDENLFGSDFRASGTGSYAKATSVPEPAILSMLGLSLLGFAFARRRRA